MTHRKKTIITSAAAFLAASLCTFLLYASVAAGAPSDAGPDHAALITDGGPDAAALTTLPTVTTTTTTTTAPSATIHDPIVEPAAALSDLTKAKKAGGWAGLVFLILVFALRAIGKVAPSISRFAFLGRGRAAIIIASGASMSMSLYDLAMQGGTWTAMLLVVGATALAWMQPIPPATSTAPAP